MNKYLIFFIFIFISTTYSQEKSIDYSKLIKKIKDSNIFLDYSNEFMCNKNLKVSCKDHSICEFINVIDKSKISEYLLEYCKNINLLNFKFKTNINLKNKSDKGIKKMGLLFTEVFDDFIIAQIKSIDNKNNKSIIYLFKINNNQFDILSSEYMYTD